MLPKTPNNYPNQAHASSYAITLHYLKTVAAIGAKKAVKSGRAAVARMKATPTDDDAFGRARSVQTGEVSFRPIFLS